MDPEKKVQAEDKPVVKEPEVKPEAVVQNPKKSFLNRALPWVIVGVVCFLAGAAVIFFTLYQPKVTALKAAQSDLAASVDKATQLQTQLDTVNSDLTAANAAIAEKTDTLITAVKYGLIYEFQADVNASLVSLALHEPGSAKQSLGYASADLVELATTDLDADTLAGFKTKIEDATANAVLKPDDAISTLKTLQADLLNMITHLQ